MSMYVLNLFCDKIPNKIDSILYDKTSVIKSFLDTMTFLCYKLIIVTAVVVLGSMGRKKQ